MQAWSDLGGPVPYGYPQTAPELRCLEIGNFDLAAAKKLRRRRTRRQPARRLRCARCGNAITDPEQRIAMGGTHAHRFTNPGGWVYDIGCFRSAPGCTQVGDPVAEHTWFAGYRWQIAVCGRCGEHMGWRYLSGDGDTFYGLILDRLVDEQ